MTFLLDTNVISELQRPRPDERVCRWFEMVTEQDIYLSVITIGEIAQGIEKVKAQEQSKAQALTRWLTELRVRFADRLIPVDVEIAERWGQLSAEAVRAGLKPAYSDNLLAATALVRGLVLVTRNVKDFARTPVLLENPWA